MLQASSEVLGACLVTQPRKLADKKSSFLRALRRESSEPNAEATPTSRVSPPPTVTPENTDKQVIKHHQSQSVSLAEAAGDLAKLFRLHVIVSIFGCCFKKPHS